MAADIYAIGGGELIYKVLSAVTLLLNGGGGILHALTTIGISMAAILVYFLCLSGTVEYIMKHWAIPLGLIMGFGFVPTTTVWVHDDVSQFHRKLDNVPLGLAQFSAHITGFSRNITSMIEMGFSTPDDLKYHKTGYMFGSDILEKAKEFKIVNQNFRENMRNFVGQCVKYDIMLNNKYTFDDLRDSTDLWGLVTSNPSKARGIMWLPIKGGKAQYITCAGMAQRKNSVYDAKSLYIMFPLSFVPWPAVPFIIGVLMIVVYMVYRNVYFNNAMADRWPRIYGSGIVISRILGQDNPTEQKKKDEKN